MSKLIQKSGYIKNGNAGGYMKYIATREGVERLHGNGQATAGQKKLIQQLLDDFPDARELFEYEDYIASPTFETASEFITMALDANMHDLQPGDTYMKYIATRPRVQKRGEHGLFGSEGSVNLLKTLEELNAHDGNVWTFIYSLRRSDAAHLGYENAESWRGLILSHKAELAEAMRIPVESFRWYAAFHDEGVHPHIHMMVWSDDPKQGFLTRDGIAKMRSTLTNDIFEQELHRLYVKKDVAYKDLTATAQEVMQQLIASMKERVYSNSVIEQKMMELTSVLENTTGKKQYGYLRKPLKEIVDAIVDELGNDPEVARCYDAWHMVREEIAGFYNGREKERPQLSQQKEFRRIKNMVISEAENIRLGIPTFEDERMNDDSDPELFTTQSTSKGRSVYEQAADYRKAKELLYDYDTFQTDKSWAIRSLEKLWEEGFSVAAHLLGKVYRDGVEVPQDRSIAKEWFLRSAQAGNDYSQYALGKMLLEEKSPEAVAWLQKAAELGNQHAQYKLGKLYLTGEQVEKDIATALRYLKDSAQRNNQFAQYTLGKLYLQGVEVKQDREIARQWLELSAAQGNQYAQFFLDRFNDIRDPSIIISATRLLHHMSKIFQNNSQPPTNPNGIRIDSKRRRRLQEKRMAMGHKRDDHEEQVNYQQFM